MIERFLKYVKMGTNSDPASPSIPSTPVQKDIAKVIVEDMKAMGIADAFTDEFGYVYGTVPGNNGKKSPVIGFIAHMDTVIDMSDQGIAPKIIKNYDGSRLELDAVKGYAFTPNAKHKGHDLIVTDGSTLLGADDKAGIVEILEAAKYFIDHPEIKHGTIKIAFTPDEEIGRGTVKFDVPGFGADFAYTVDGGGPECIAFETFNASAAHIEIAGKNTHPGSAKGVMINSLLLAMELQAMLPEEQKPQYTEGFEGFYHLNGMSGNVDQCSMTYIIRDHDKEKFEYKKQFIKKAADFLAEKYPAASVKVTLNDTYYNMREPVLANRHLVDIASEVITAHGYTPRTEPVRGGTDGAQLSYKGLPCPNLGTGGHNAHSRYEYASVNEMYDCLEIIKAIAVRYGEIEL